jgi:MerR family transcriptional regulator, redox-sensitive transcriptional activator SoxR
MSGKEPRKAPNHSRTQPAMWSVKSSSMTSSRPALTASSTKRRTVCSRSTARQAMPAGGPQYYEAQGLLPEAPRLSGQRRYTDETLDRLGVIDVAKRAGFSLDDIRTLLTASDAGEPAHTQLQELARRKLPEVEEVIARADAVRRWLTTATGCGCETLDVCALFARQEPLPPEGLHLVLTGPSASDHSQA